MATRWYQHFLKVLNIPSEYRDDVIDNMPLLASILELDSPSSEEELPQALSKLRKRKAGGKSGILPELILRGGAELWSRILKLMQQVWEEGRVVREWQDAVVVPVPKKGDVRHCDNWRGIGLLDVVGKIMARIMKERLEELLGKFSQNHSAVLGRNKVVHVKRLNSFHNCCIRTILGVTRYQQWKERITSVHLASTFGMQQLISYFVMEQCLRWLGHLSRMSNDRLPNKVLFGELRGKRPCHGTKRRWRDVARSDMEAIGAGDRWHELCQDRKEWFELCQKGL